MQHGHRWNLEVTMPSSTQDLRVKLLMSYDIVSESQQSYYEFVLREFIPKAQELGLAISEAWHTAYGNYPVRMTGFVAPDRITLDKIMQSDEWADLRERLDPFVTNLQFKIVPYREGFQF
jgi:hypothetical protein